MNWRELNSEEQFIELLNGKGAFAVFKHSTRCSISSMAKARLEREWKFSQEELPIFYLDLIRYRSVSNLIAVKSHVEHESPQLIVFVQGRPVYDASHHAIQVTEIIPFIH